MKKAILATKVGMTQIFNADGVLVPVTVLHIDIRGDIALDDGTAQASLVVQALVSAQDRGGLARTGARKTLIT